MYLPKIAFPYWSNVCFGCDWHISTSNWHYLLSVSQKDENPALFSVSSIKCRLAHCPYSLSSFGQFGHRETMLWNPKWQHKFQSVSWRIIDFTRNQQGVLRVTRRLFGYCRKWQQQGMFWVTQNVSGYSRKPCCRVASPKSGNLS